MTGLVQGYQQVLLLARWRAVDVWGFTLGWLVLIAVLLNMAIKRSRDQLVDWL
jgi:lipopolysaccharide transport system permease protein